MHANFYTRAFLLVFSAGSSSNERNTILRDLGAMNWRQVEAILLLGILSAVAMNVRYCKLIFFCEVRASFSSLYYIFDQVVANLIVRFLRNETVWMFFLSRWNTFEGKNVLMVKDHDSPV